MTVFNANCLDGMRWFPDNTFDSIVTDPPYELGFMGKKWDSSGIANNVAMWREALRVLKPGGHLLAFSGSRTYHRVTCAIEDAGFEIRDQIMWIYGSGFPKSHNLDGGRKGWGTALKPAHEPICVARKPLVGTVAANVLQFGTGAINIDGCRVPTDEIGEVDRQRNSMGYRGGNGSSMRHVGSGTRNTLGRWPANLIHDGSDEVLAAFPDTPKSRRNTDASQAPYTPNGKNAVYGSGMGTAAHAGFDDDTGSAARFFYCAKASKSDRDEGLTNFPSAKAMFADGTGLRKNGDGTVRNQSESLKNTHPTVKPTALMCYLCRLVTPPGGSILDPFAGSGSTGKAATLEGFAFIGFELDEHYAAIANARLKAVA